ncbi:macrophage mannose receptor 1-like isoform X2 [Betta splendens]|uniref:Macrophage mannose receptor 1-like isoform X2 n=1 Tax=Betta splendens TaxID=158456 RepID=A0A9W2Y4D9_BETSP|nr:macrophage mannose receptor 1-like isoform X2 [Betta splendens]
MLNRNEWILLIAFSRMREPLLFALTLSGLCAATYKQFHYIRNAVTWSQAQSFCRSMYSDLATIENPDDNQAIINIQELLNFVWIGYHDDLRIWSWALGNERFNNDVDYDSWGVNEPWDLRSGNRCAVVTQGGFWHDMACDSLQFAVCYSRSGSSPYAFVATAMTWYQARQHCLTTHTDLASLTTYYENHEASLEVLGDAWMGLHRQPWAWSDASTSNYTNWGSVQPTNIESMTSCVTVSTTTGLWWQADCWEEHEFVCEAVSTSPSSTIMVQDKIWTKTLYKLKLKWEEVLNDPAVWNQLLQQLQVHLKRHTLADINLYWTRTYEQTFSKRQAEKCSPVYSK